MVNVRMDIPELVERLRKIGSDTQDCEVKEAVRKLPESLPETISAFANKEGGIIILGLSEKSNFTPVEGFDAKKIFFRHDAGRRRYDAPCPHEDRHGSV